MYKLFFFDDIINITNFGSNRIKIDQKSYKNIVIYYIGYITAKNLSYVKIKSVSPLYNIIDIINVYTEESNRNKYLMLVSSDKN